jgi:hypothetical protein
VSGLTGTITGISVILKNLSHGSPSDLHILLQGPTGTTCMLMQKCGGSGSISDVTLEISDDGSAIPTLVPVTSGKWAPTQIGLENNLPAPTPNGPYGSALSGFNGTDPNGCWSLWIWDSSGFDSGTMDHGWDIVFSLSTDQSLIAAGDLHVQDGASATLAEVAALAAGSDGFLCLGDVNNPNFSEDAWTRFWNFGFDEDVLAKTMFVPGNHDWTEQSVTVKGKTQTFWRGDMAAVYGSSFPEGLVTDPDTFAYSAKFGQWKVICVPNESITDDVTALENGGSIYEFVSDELDEAGYHCILISHRPRWSSDTTHGDYSALDSIWRLAVQKGAVVWLSGHVHISEVQPFRDEGGITRYFGGCAQVVASLGINGFYAFDPLYTEYRWHQNSVNLVAKITFNESGATVQFLTTPGAVVAGSVFRFAILNGIS